MTRRRSPINVARYLSLMAPEPYERPAGIEPIQSKRRGSLAADEHHSPHTGDSGEALSGGAARCLPATYSTGPFVPVWRSAPAKIVL